MKKDKSNIANYFLIMIFIILPTILVPFFYLFNNIGGAYAFGYIGIVLISMFYIGLRGFDDEINENREFWKKNR